MDALERYLHAHSSPEPELLAELDRETHRRTVQPRMLSGHLQGRLLELLVRMIRPRAVLEIGTFTGYSALALAAGLDDDATRSRQTTNCRSWRNPSSTEANTAIKSGFISAPPSNSHPASAAGSTWCSSTATNASTRPITGC